MIKAVIFDMNGVIIDDEPVHEKAFRLVCKEFSVELTSEIYEELCFGRTDVEGFDNIIKIFNLRNILPEELVEKKAELYFQFIEGNAKSYRGVLDLIKLLKGKIKLAVASNSREDEVDATLKNFGIKDFFDVVITGSDIKKGKPDPESYLLATKKLNERPEDCLAIEDSPAGVASAKAAGLKCAAITTTHKLEALKNADLVINDFSEIDIEFLVNHFLNLQ